MKLVVLTTQTPHHAYFVREVAKRFNVAKVYCETKMLRPAFDTAHSFEAERDDYERQLWFGGADQNVAEFAPTELVTSMNEATAIASLETLAPDVVLVF